MIAKEELWNPRVLVDFQGCGAESCLNLKAKPKRPDAGLQGCVDPVDQRADLILVTVCIPVPVQDKSQLVPRSTQKCT